MFSLPQMETNIEVHTRLKGRVVEHSHNGCTYNTTPAPKAQRHWERWDKNIVKNSKNREFAVRLHLLEMSEAVPIKSHQYACLKNNTKGILMWKEVSSWTISSRQRTTSSDGCWERWNNLPQGKSTAIDYSMPNGQF